MTDEPDDHDPAGTDPVRRDACAADDGRAQIFRGETAGVGDPVYTAFVAFANEAANGDVQIQVNAGQTLTQSMLRGGRGDIDFFSAVPSLVPLMAEGRAMYAPIEDAAEAAANLRAITPESAFLSVNVPLHPGAIRYYEEAGYTIPEALRL